jgi:hypothetical protein
MKDFVANIEQVNAIADQADGFVWRMKSDKDNRESQYWRLAVTPRASVTMTTLPAASLA